MPETGLMEPRANTRPRRAVIDFGVDGSWEPASARPRGRRRELADETSSLDRIPVPVSSRFAAPPAPVAGTDAALTDSPSRSAPRARRAAAQRPRRSAEPAIVPVAPSRRPSRTAIPARATAPAVATDAATAVAPATSSAPVAATAPAATSAPAPERRTIQIRGRGAEGYAWSSSTSSRSASVARGPRRSSPDRMALWAVLLGLLLVLIAATSAHAAALT